MSHKKPIKIGDTFERTYYFWEPLEGADPPAPDPDAPIDIEDATITFVVKNGAYTYEFANTVEAPDVITKTGNRVDVLLSNTATEVFTEGDGKNTSHLKFVIDGKEYSKAVRSERIVKQTSL